MTSADAASPGNPAAGLGPTAPRSHDAEPSGTATSRHRPDRRERKKLRTRALIRSRAIDLFERRGYQNTTVEDIAEAADVGPVTVYRHFGSKEAIILGISEEGELAGSLPLFEGMSAYQGLLAVLGAFTEDRDSAWFDGLARQVRLIATSPELSAAMWARTPMWAAGLVPHLSGSPLVAQVRARAVVDACVEAVMDWTASGDGSRSSLLGRAGQALDALCTIADRQV